MYVPDEPSSFFAASKFSKWWDAMCQEFVAFQHNKTWSLVLPPLSTNILGCRWVFRTKTKAKGLFE